MPLQYYDVYWPTWVKGTVHQNNEKFSHYLLTSVPMLSQVKFLHPHFVTFLEHFSKTKFSFWGEQFL